MRGGIWDILQYLKNSSRASVWVVGIEGSIGWDGEIVAWISYHLRVPPY